MYQSGRRFARQRGLHQIHGLVATDAAWHAFAARFVTKKFDFADGQFGVLAGETNRRGDQ